MTRVIFSPIILLCVTSLCESAPLNTTTLKGKADGPHVRVIVGRGERAKACGVDDQLAGLALKKGELVIETHAEGKPIETADGDYALELQLLWPETVKDTSEDEKKPDQNPQVSATDPSKVKPLLTAAIADSFNQKLLDALKVDPMEKKGAERVEIHFPSPQSGVSKARQFRISRRLTASLLAELGMIEPLKTVWPPNFPSHAVICNYDAEGVGYYGSTLLERAVDETTLDMEVVSVCPEDIRDGALDKAAGVMFPGGSGKSIAKALRPEGVALVRDYVAKGHGYYGVCAGAYLAGSGLPEYTGMMHLKHDQPWAKGKGMVKLDLTEEGAALLGSEFTHIETRYNCGPVFPDLSDPPPGDEHQPVKVLAKFASAATDDKGVTHDSMIGAAAILMTTWKKGHVVTCSPHPESHSQFNAMVARCIGLSLGIDPKKIVANPAKSS